MTKLCLTEDGDLHLALELGKKASVDVGGSVQAKAVLSVALGLFNTKKTLLIMFVCRVAVDLYNLYPLVLLWRTTSTKLGLRTSFAAQDQCGTSLSYTLVLRTRTAFSAAIYLATRFCLLSHQAGRSYRSP